MRRFVGLALLGAILLAGARVGLGQVAGRYQTPVEGKPGHVQWINFSGNTLQDAFDDMYKKRKLHLVSRIEVQTGRIRTDDWLWLRNRNGAKGRVLNLYEFTVLPTVTSVQDMPDPLVTNKSEGRLGSNYLSICKVSKLKYVSRFAFYGGLSALDFPDMEKCGEEATEVVVAAMKGSREETIYELADLCYHALVLMVQCGVTLDEVREADLLLHVVDISHPNFEEHIQSVNQILAEIHSADKPTIMVFNKIDAYTNEEIAEDDLATERTKKHFTLDEWKQTWMQRMGRDVLFISALNKNNLEEFREVVYEKVKEIHITRFPFNNFLYEKIDE